MNRKWLIVAVGLGLLLVTASVLVSPALRGASLAAMHQIRGESAVYRLGCVFGPSADPAEFRLEELLAKRYGLYCETTGGFAPSDELVRFTSAYNFVTLRIARARYGRDFWERTLAEARKDVVIRKVVVKGCFSPGSREIVLASGERVVLVPSLVRDDTEWLEGAGAVTVAGTLISVRAGEWNRTFGPQLHASTIERDPHGLCGARSQPAV